MKMIIKTIFAIVAITMALTLLFTTQNSISPPPPPENPSQPIKPAASAAKRVGRFLQQNENPRAAEHCNKDEEICSQISEGRNTTCCNNKCMDLRFDENNCGACKKKCAFTESCCRGKCVNLAFDKRHCGACNKRCMTGGFCIYGMCDYA